MLLPGESVFYIARGRRPLSLLEQLTAGWWTYLLASATVVFTNRRILFFPVKNDGSWKESVRAVQWGDVTEITATGWFTRNLAFKYRNGKTETYMSFSIGDGKKLAAIAPALIEAGAGEQSPAQGAVQLCPDCRGVLTPGIYRCGNCGLIFKDEKTMIWRSIFLPAGGYFYTGHPLIAIPPAIVELYILILVGLALFDPNRRLQRKEDLTIVLAVFALSWGLETAVTILHCRRYIREFIPLKRRAAAAFKSSAATSKA